MAGLVLEGGAFRGLYTDGVLDALLDANVIFDYVVGVSAGISNGYSYVSRQKGRNWEIIKNYLNDKRYFGFSNYFKCRSMFGIDFAFGEIPKKLIPFDMETFLSVPGKAIAGITDAKTGEIEFFDKKDTSEHYKLLTASCAIPIVFPAIKFGGKKYFDGGICDPIPVKKAIADGNEKNLIVLTQPEGYRKEPSSSYKLVKFGHKKMADVIKNRHNVYNETVDFCKELEKNKKAVALFPSKDLGIERFERDLVKLKELYDLGYSDTMARIDEIKELFN